MASFLHQTVDSEQPPVHSTGPAQRPPPACICLLLLRSAPARPLLLAPSSRPFTSITHFGMTFRPLPLGTISSRRVCTAKLPQSVPPRAHRHKHSPNPLRRLLGRMSSVGRKIPGMLLGYAKIQPRNANLTVAGQNARALGVADRSHPHADRPHDDCRRPTGESPRRSLHRG